MPSVKSKNSSTISTGGTKNGTKVRTVRSQRSSSPSSTSSASLSSSGSEDEGKVLTENRKPLTKKPTRKTSVTRPKTTKPNAPPATFNLLSPIPSIPNGASHTQNPPHYLPSSNNVLSPIVPTSPDLLTFNSNNNNNNPSQLPLPIPIPSSSSSSSSLTSSAVSSLNLASLQEKITAMQTAFESLSTSSFSSQLKWKEHEQALKQQLQAQQLLITELRNENQSLRKHMDPSNGSTFLPLQGIVRSLPYQTLLNENNQLQTTITKHETTIQELLARPMYPAGTLSILELFGTLTGFKIIPRSPSSSGSIVGIYDIETIEPENGQIITFILDIFRVDNDNNGDNTDSTSANTAMYPTGIAIEYTPGLGREYLPEFLQSVITFGSDQAPMFLSKITEKLRRMDDEEEEQSNDNGTATMTTDQQPIATCLDSTLEAVATTTILSTTPTVVLQPRSSRKPGIVPSSPSSATNEESNQGPITASIMGTMVEIDSMTPHAVRRGRTLPVFTSPPPNVTAVITSIPPNSTVKGLPNNKTPSITPLAHARGIKAPFGTPAPSTLQYTESELMVSNDQHSDTNTNGNNENTKDGDVMMITDDTVTHNSRTARGRSISVDRFHSSSSSLSSSLTTVDSLVPTTVNQPSRRSARVASTTTTTRAQSVRSHRGRRSIGHVVTAEGFLHDASPASKMGLRKVTKDNTSNRTVDNATTSSTKMEE